MRLLVVVVCLRCSLEFAGEIHTAQGSLAGEVTTNQALLQTRLTKYAGPELDEAGDIPGASGVACFEYGLHQDLHDAQQTDWMEAKREHDFIVRVAITGLKPGTTYYYRPLFGTSKTEIHRGVTGSFTTLPGAESTGEISFVIGSCMNYHSFMHGKSNGGGPRTATEEDKRLGYPSYAAMKELHPQFFVGTGDIVYYDHPKVTAAQDIKALRKKWHEQFHFPRMIQFFTQTPTYWSKDDHDFRYNDSDLTGENLPSVGLGIEMFREQMPIYPTGDETSPTYRTHRINKDLQIWLTEGRDFRSPNKSPDEEGKSLWGDEQRAWLMRTLKESDATWKILISPTPMVGPDDAYKTDNHVNLGGFRHEADAFFDWLKANEITGFSIVCGDRHWQYHSIHPTGVEEFGCGALNDENSRLGVPPGSPKGTDPDAKIRQPYLYTEPTGGFLRVTVHRTDDGTSHLTIEHHDDHGKLMNRVEKRGGAG